MDAKLPIHSIDHTVIFARQMAAMREFYGTTLGFPLQREPGPRWVEYRVGSNVLALAERGGRFNDPAPPIGGPVRAARLPGGTGRGGPVRGRAEGARRPLRGRAHRPAVRAPHAVLPGPGRQRPGDLRGDLGE